MDYWKLLSLPLLCVPSIIIIVCAKYHHYCVPSITIIVCQVSPLLCAKYHHYCVPSVIIIVCQVSSLLCVRSIIIIVCQGSSLCVPSIIIVCAKYHHYYVCQISLSLYLLRVPSSATKGPAVSRPLMCHQQIPTSPDQLSWHKTAPPIQTVCITISCEMTRNFGPNVPRCCPAVHITRILRHSVHLLFSDCTLSRNVTLDIWSAGHIRSDSATASQHFAVPQEPRRLSSH